MTHYFAGIPVPFGQIRDVLQELNSVYDFPSHYKVIPHEEDYHITLVFFGALTPEGRKEAESALRAAADSCTPFTVQIAGLSHFGNPKGPRVVTLAVQDNPVLTDLYDRAGRLLAGVLDRPLRKPYVPHVTIAKKTISGRPLSVGQHSFPPIPLPVTSITLYRIEPSSSPKYVPEAVIPLGGGPSA